MVDVTPRVRIGEVRSCLGELDGPTKQTRDKFDDIIGRFELFAKRAFDVELISEVLAEHVEAFVRAKGDNRQPSVATMHLRRSNLRLLFRIARREFGFEGDPTIDLVLPARSSLTTRPLTNDEIALGRSYSLHTLVATRQPAAWALGEAGGISAEMVHITIGDLDLDCGDGPRVWLHGSRKRKDRWGLLDEWSAGQLECRASALRGTQFLIYQGEGSEQSRQASCCIAVKETMIRAGLDAEPDVRPNSLAAWAGVMALEETGTIDGAARRLGIRSLDAAAQFINYDWQ